MSTFTWKPDRSPTADIDFKVRDTAFGDGYRQRAPDGINSIVDSWPLTFTGESSKINQITAFLDARLGVEAFDWTNPRGLTGRYLASKYSLTPLGSGVWRVSVPFDRDFATTQKT